MTDDAMRSWGFATERRGLDCVHVGSYEIRPGDRVRIRPRRQADILDLALAGQIAFVESIEEDFESRIYFALTLENDPGRDLGQLHQVGHRFFFGLDEVEPVGDAGETE